MMLLDKTNTLVIVPAYNEQESIVSVIKEIQQTEFPFVVIDDGSTDETRKRAIEAGARTISLPFNFGVGGALKCGFNYAVESQYHAVIQFDADGQHKSLHIPDLVASANASNSVLIIGSRHRSIENTNDVSNFKKFVMKMLVRLVQKQTNVELTDSTSGFRLIREPLLSAVSKSFPTNYLGDTFEALFVIGKNGYQISEIPTAMRNRVAGTPSSNFLGSTLQLAKSLFVSLTGLHFRIPHTDENSGIQS